MTIIFVEITPLHAFCIRQTTPPPQTSSSPRCTDLEENAKNLTLISPKIIKYKLFRNSILLSSTLEAIFPMVRHKIQSYIAYFISYLPTFQTA
jgi:hypothetical protein